MANLYELEQNFKNLIDILENSEDEALNEVIAKSLGELEEDITKKAENIVKYTKNIKAEALALKEEAKRLSEKQRILENRATRLEEYLFSTMKFAGKEKIKAGIFDISIKRNPAAIKITSEELIPETYFKITKTIDKSLLKISLKNGINIPGAELEQKESLKIK